MFGLKIRSWMENHIVRPRKKGNKNKNGNSGNLATSINTQNGHKGISNQGDSSIGSPARRSEVSPIQNHTTSRVGWQTPQDEEFCLGNDPNYSYVMKSSTISPKNMYRIPKTNGTHELINNMNHYPYSKSVDGKYLTRAFDVHANNSSSSQRQENGANSIKSTSINIKSASGSATMMTAHHQMQQQPQRFEGNEKHDVHRSFKCGKASHSDDYKGYNGKGFVTNGTSSVQKMLSTNQPAFQSNGISTNNCSTSAQITKNDEQPPLQRNYHVQEHQHIQQSQQHNYFTEKNRFDVQMKSEEQTNVHQTNGFLMKHSKLMANSNNGNDNSINNNNINDTSLSGYNRSARNEGRANERHDDIVIDKFLNETRYGKLINRRTDGNVNGHKDAFKVSNGIANMRPMPTLPPPPSTPPPPLKSMCNGNGQHYQSKQQNERYATNGKYQSALNANANSVDSLSGTDTSAASSKSNRSNNNISDSLSATNPTVYYANTCSGKAIHATNHNHYQHQTSLVNGHIQSGTAAQSGNEINGIDSALKAQQQSQPGQNHTQHPSKPRYGVNGTHLMPAPGNHPLAHVINSLSSPESAYSTGYSTDGTSPGTTNAPEYYINMRTGTHYFPRGMNGVAAVERSRQKFGLNKIEETVGESTVISSHRRTESCDLGRRFPPPAANADSVVSTQEICNFMTARGMSPDLQRRLAIQNYKGLESPSPRQRCRIRTNPWFSNADAATLGNSMVKKMDTDTSSTSSGIKSSSDAGTDNKPNKKPISSESESSSSTEIEISRKSFSPNTIRRRRQDKQLSERHSHQQSGIGGDSDDEDATLNELMGKFDESYVYEKETDILSDSDQTECVSDLTGQEGGDECDTDELLDIDYIDTGSIQEITDKDVYRNTGSCTYHHHSTQQLEKRPAKLRKSRKSQNEENGSRRKKRLTRTRKRNSECRDGSQTSNKTDSPGRYRESRSVGGTPVSLRRNQLENQNKSTSKMAPLSSRCNSLTFTEIHSIRSRFLAIAESEKALLKADIEADVKYKQLIHEAETILVSMKTTALRETPVPSPSRRLCNMPANKRVEMLRNCEADLRRELSKTQKQVPDVAEEATSVPSSPKANGYGGRFSPRKTHLTNFINQNVSPVELMRRQNATDSQSIEYHAEMKRSPRLQFNGTKVRPPKSPTPRRRFRSQSPRVCIEASDSDSDENSRNGNPINHKRHTINGNKENKLRHSYRKNRHPVEKLPATEDILNRNTNIEHKEKDALDNRPFRSMDMADMYAETYYCPQSEPLKRKIYSEKTLDRLQRSLEMESELPKKAILQKISMLRRERAAVKSYDYTKHESHSTLTVENDVSREALHKRQLILSTIEDLKRSLEDQSIELNGLNNDD